METKTKSTKEAILEQLHENTGSHFLDSGGAYGRHHERNRTKTWDDFVKEPVRLEAHVYKHGSSPELELLGYISVAAWLNANVEYCPEMQASYEAWCEAHDPDNDMYDVQRMELFAKNFGAKSSIHYTYNCDNDLSQDIQFIEFTAEVDGYQVSMALIQLHQGCDARGGMGSPKAYQVNADYFGRWNVDMYSCLSHQWDEGGYPCDSHTLAIKDYPVSEFVFENRLERDLEALAQTNKDTPGVRAAMTKHAETVEREAFEEYCEAQEDHCFVVFKHKAYFVGNDGPEELYADCSGMYQ